MMLFSAGLRQQIDAYADELYESRLFTIRASVDRMMARLMACQFVGGILIALFISPRTWSGPDASIHPHLYAAIFLGGLISVFPIYLSKYHAGKSLTRAVNASAQVLWSALFIHLTGGRIETHFHVFASLALLGAYRDWKILIPATLIVASDHLFRGLFWPQSVYGVLSAPIWRTIEHAAWVSFTDFFIVLGILRSQDEMREISSKQSQLEFNTQAMEEEIENRTNALRKANSDLQNENHENQQLQAQLVQAQKLESIGQLAAGIAHEINTPTQYISDNLRFLEEALGGYEDLAQSVQEYLDKNPDSRLHPIYQQTCDEHDLEYLREESPGALAQALEGTQRVTTIVRSMKEFSHPGSDSMEPIDLNRAICNTIEVARNEWKYTADLDTDLDETLPSIPGLLGELNQVFLNMIINAAHAITERNGEHSGDKGTITISTRNLDDKAEIRIADTGSGISEEHLPKIFDLFYTTKPVGQGTGQGLAIAHDVIVTKHSGTIHVESTLGTGTTFVITLPLETSHQQVA